ncbi:MAG: hypothetical protein OEM79_00760 [Nitrosopumilus sp.]|nr:hypothetical protein [Nitrosopumilus sp.]
MEIRQTQFHSSLQKNSPKIFLIGSILASLGILLVTVGGSWDITNHLLNKPESFFSPPHALMYSGVAIGLIGAAISFLGYRNLQESKDVFRLPLQLKFIGIFLLVGAGPFDYVWHSNFGLDGLLSPPHFTLLGGMLFCSLGGMFGISRFLKTRELKNNFANYLLVLATLPVWLAGSGVISSLSLPFSNTDYFEFNPEPTFAFVIATVAYPFFISLICIVTAKLSNFKPGVITILGGLFLLIYGMTAIVPNFALLESVEFYSMNMIPIVMADLIVSFRKTKKVSFVAGGILGSGFYMVYYPYIMYTYNEFLLGKLVSPSMIYHTYFELMPQVIQFTIIPAVIMGVIGALVAFRFSNKILVKN